MNIERYRWTGDSGPHLTNGKVYEFRRHPWTHYAHFTDDQGNFNSLETVTMCEDGWVPAEKGPIRTVTRREIVPGDYGPIYVLASSNSCAVIQLLDSNGEKPTRAIAFTAGELREAAHLFNQLAEALEERQ